MAGAGPAIMGASFARELSQETLLETGRWEVEIARKTGGPCVGQPLCITLYYGYSLMERPPGALT